MKPVRFYENLNELVTDSRFRGFGITKNFDNFFGDYGNKESDTMQAFSWFMNPNGAHGFKDLFYKELLTTTWGMIHGQNNPEYKKFKDLSFYKNISPIFIQKYSFMNTYIDRDIVKAQTGCDVVMTDIGSKTMIVINNHYNKTNCDKAYTYFNTIEYACFENKLFITLDMGCIASADYNWIYMNNEWLVSLCSNLLETSHNYDNRTVAYLQDYYQFLTGTAYGTLNAKHTEYPTTLVKEYYTTLVELRNYKAEMIQNINLLSINPREYATTYFGKILEKEYDILSLYWNHKNTFNAFFQIVDLETVTKDMDKIVENKSYFFERDFVRNGLCFSPVFKKATYERDYVNNIFDIEIHLESNKNAVMSLVVNKNYWDKMNSVQRTAFKKCFDFNGSVLKDKITIWNKFYGQDWKNQNFCNEIVDVMDKIENYFTQIQFKVA